LGTSWTRCWSMSPPNGNNGAPRSFVPRLTPRQRQAVRLEIMGSRPAEIAKELGLSPATITNWRKLPEYRDHRDMLLSASDAEALDDARVLRLAASRVLRRHIQAMDEALEAGMDPTEAVPALRLVLDVYRATSAQTGLGETLRHEVTVTAPEEALAEMRRMLAAAPAEVLDVVADEKK